MPLAETADQRADDLTACDPADSAWGCFCRSILESLEMGLQVQPVPACEDSGDSTVRAMQRARRYTWLHARHQLNWSMFEAIRISVRLAEAFAEWTRRDAPDVDALAARLQEVEQEARRMAPVRDELRFVDQLMNAATATELPLAQMDLAMEAFRRVERPARAS